MRRRDSFFVILILLFQVVPCLAKGATHPAVLLISIDGLRPDYITAADEHHSKIPVLRQLLAEGVHARVHGVLPSSTYPSHTSILSGVAPAKHGIVGNHPFDPAMTHPDSWCWFTADIKVPTLWHAAADAGYVVGNVAWPVSVGATDVRYNIPEYADNRNSSDLQMVEALAGRPLMGELAKAAGPFIVDVRSAVARDWARTRYAVELIRQKQVRFITVHLAATDHFQHRSGPFHKTVLGALEEIDEMVGAMRDGIRAEDAGAYVCIVSDHGFARIDHSLRLDQAFVKAGLIKLKSPIRDSVASSGVAEWIAMPWSAGGSAEIILKDPKDGGASERVRNLLQSLAGDPANGIAGILDRSAIDRFEADPRASFWVDMKPGYSISEALEPDGPLVTARRPAGTHGYAPTHAEMDSLFLLVGPGIASGQDVGPIDMRSIAPTLASLMHVAFSSAEVPGLAIIERDH
jgi:predicted AlkP superfamily pyrophosphatase or phosphodiesterase